MQITGSRTSRVTKSRRPTLAQSLGLKRSSSSSLSSSPRRKSSQSASSSPDYDKLDDTGVIVALGSDLNFRDVPQYVAYIRSSTFSNIPESGSAMNSMRIAQVLNYRKDLPPIVTIAHVEALGSSSTKTEREIAELQRKGVLRRITIPQRGVGAAAIGDGIASVAEWQRIVQVHPNLDEELKAKYIEQMNANPTSATVSGTAFTSPELSALTTAGFLTSKASANTAASIFAAPSTSLASISTSGSRHASGSLAAVGGTEATRYIPGGGSGHRPQQSAMYNFSLPNGGAHIKLLGEARAHLLSLLKKYKFKEAPKDILRERWDGGVAASNEQSKAKKMRGEWNGISPGRTKKWKHFYGMRFDWILEECVGAGLVECFETGSVGVGVRIL